MSHKYDGKEFRDEVARIIGMHPDEIDARLQAGYHDETDLNAVAKMNVLMSEIRTINPLAVQLVRVANAMDEGALRCCIAVPPSTPHEDTSQRIMRHVLDIKRIALEFLDDN